MRVLVTGADGFMGSNMVSFLKERGHFVRAIGRGFTSDRSQKFGEADEVIPTDLRDLGQVIRACKEIDYVCHFAADMGGVGYFSEHDYSPFFNNMLIDMNILQACEFTRVKRLYYSSSACIYPTQLQMDITNPPVLKEDMIFPAQSDQMYGWEKLMATMLCQRAPQELDARVGIQHTVYGPFQETQGDRMKFPTAIATKAIKSAQDGGNIEIWGDGSQLRTYLYIDDALEKIYRVLFSDTYNGPVNIGGDQLVSVLDVARICCHITGAKEIFQFNDAKPSGVLARGCDNTKFEAEYGYKNQVDLTEGFTRLIDWINENGRD